MSEDKTVYIVGAGFSHGYCAEKYPLTGNMFSSNLPEGILSNGEKSMLRDYLGKFLDGDIREFDIEDALAYCDLVEQGQMKFKRDIDNRLVAMQLSSILKKFLIQRLQMAIKYEASESYMEWIKSVGNNDYIITYNYDLLLESLICGQNSGSIELYENLRKEIMETRSLSEPFRPLEKGYLLKLHGSLNWYVCSNDLCPNHSTIVIRDREYDEPEKQFGFCRNCSSDLEPVIIYPGISKRYERFPKIGHLWTMAENALFVATKIIIIGYSFRAQDIATSFMMRNSLWFDDPGTKRWIIIDPKHDCIKERLTALLPTRKCEIEKCQSYESVDDFIKNRMAKEQ